MRRRPYTFDLGRIPVPVRVLRALGRPGGRLDSTEVIEEATRRARLHDFGDDAFVAVLDRLLESGRDDTTLSDAARATLRRHCVSALVRRLRVEQCVRRHPEIESGEVRAPVFVVGFPRSGTTFLHHLLHQSRLVRAPEYWQLRSPTPPPDVRRQRTDPRIAAAWAALAVGRVLLPEMDVLHPTGPHLPEECGYLLDPTLMNPLVPSGQAYQRWWRSTDLDAGYRYHRRMLQLLSFRWPTHRWALKAPFHLHHLDALLAVYPDALVVHVHRSLRESVPSTASWVALRARAFSPTLDPDPAALGRDVLESTVALAARVLDQRRRLPEPRFLDVQYEDLVGDPIGVVRTIIERLGEATPDRRAATLRRWADAASRKKRSVPHVYSLEQFRLDPEEIDVRLADYEARFRRVVR